MVVDQRSEVCVNPIYNLYAISVGVSTPIMLGLKGWARWQPPSPEVGILKIQLLKFWNFEIQWPTVTFVSHLPIVHWQGIKHRKLISAESDFWSL